MSANPNLSPASARGQAPESRHGGTIAGTTHAPGSSSSRLVRASSPRAVEPPNPSTTRYPMTLVTRARQMYGNGDLWTPKQIRDHLAAQGYPHLHLTTVRCWVVPGEADRKRERDMRSYHRRHGTEDARTLDRDAQLLALRERKLSYSDIVAVFDIYRGEKLTENQVRYRLLKLGAPVSEARSAATRRLNEARRAA